MVEVGESIVGSYLRFFESCEIIEYNLITPEEVDKFGEIDVVGINFLSKKVFLCEVITHIHTMNYGSRDITTQKIKQKLIRNIKLANTLFPDWEISHMVWAPAVGQSQEKDLLEAISDIKDNKIVFVFNEDYSSKVLLLVEKATNDIRDYKEPFLRSLQILTHLKLPQNEFLFNKSVLNFKPSKRLKKGKMKKDKLYDLMVNAGADIEKLKQIYE